MPIGTAIRIYDLARELKQDTKRVTEELRREGADVSVPSQTVSKELADKIRLKYFPRTETTSKLVRKVVKRKSSVEVKKLVEQQVQMTEIKTLELKTKKDVEQIKFIGFDSRCEFCGNYYASNYIEFHKKERCSKKHDNTPHNSKFKIRLEEQVEGETIQPVILFVSKSHSIPSQRKSKPSNLPEEIKQLNEGFSICPHCNVNVKQKRLEEHFCKCPALKFKKNPEKNLKNKNTKNTKNYPKNSLQVFRTVPSEKLSECQHCSLKLKTKNLQKHISISHPSVSFKSQKTKIRVEITTCQNCGALYSAFGTNCPQCNYYRIKIKSLTPVNKLSKCKQCGRHLTMFATSVCQFCGDK